jgi:hypothetical protein
VGTRLRESGLLEPRDYMLFGLTQTDEKSEG